MIVGVFGHSDYININRSVLSMNQVKYPVCRDYWNFRIGVYFYKIGWHDCGGVWTQWLHKYKQIGLKYESALSTVQMASRGCCMWQWGVLPPAQPHVKLGWGRTLQLSPEGWMLSPTCCVPVTRRPIPGLDVLYLTDTCVKSLLSTSE